MSVPFYLVDTFTAVPLTGNPAAVVLPGSWPEDEAMLALARELNLAATCYLVPEGEVWRLRWFSAAGELEMCGHASGDLGVKRNSSYELSMPRQDPVPIEEPGRLTDALGVRPQKVYLVRRAGNQQVIMVTLPDQEAVERLSPHLPALAAVGVRALIATAKGEEVDFVCRYFSPGPCVVEDPVTGSAYATLAPFWADQLGKDELRARQICVRGGELLCLVYETRVVVSGEAVTVLRGEIAADLL
jgi:predicted PhzF superfamily epimerase YddE/YHI9